MKNLIIFLLMCFSIYNMIPKRNEKCHWQEEFREKTFYGVVTKKIIDKSQHSVPYVLINELNTDSKDTIKLFGDLGNCYSIIQEGDTLKKDKGNDIIYKIQKGNLSFLGIVNFGCKK